MNQKKSSCKKHKIRIEKNSVCVCVCWRTNNVLARGKISITNPQICVKAPLGKKKGKIFWTRDNIFTTGISKKNTKTLFRTFSNNTQKHEKIIKILNKNYSNILWTIHKWGKKHCKYKVQKYEKKEKYYKRQKTKNHRIFQKYKMFAQISH